MNHKSLIWQLVYAIGALGFAYIAYGWPFSAVEDLIFRAVSAFLAVVFAVQLVKELRA